MPRPLAARVAVLESQMQPLQELPGQVAALDTRVASLESQFLQLRIEMRDEFLATRHELGSLRTEIGDKIDGDGGLREEMGAIVAGLREEIQSGDARLLSEIRGLKQDSRREHEKTRQYIRVLLKGRTSRRKNKK